MKKYESSHEKMRAWKLSAIKQWTKIIFKQEKKEKEKKQKKEKKTRKKNIKKNEKKRRKYWQTEVKYKTKQLVQRKQSDFKRFMFVDVF